MLPDFRETLTIHRSPGRRNAASARSRRRRLPNNGCDIHPPEQISLYHLPCVIPPKSFDFLPRSFFLGSSGVLECGSVGVFMTHYSIPLLSIPPISPPACNREIPSLPNRRTLFKPSPGGMPPMRTTAIKAPKPPYSSYCAIKSW